MCLVIVVTAHNCCGHKGLFHVPWNGRNDNHLSGSQTRPKHLEVAVAFDSTEEEEEEFTHTLKQQQKQTHNQMTETIT